MAADPVLWGPVSASPGFDLPHRVGGLRRRRFEFEPGDASPTTQQEALDVGPDLPTGARI